MVVNGLCAKNKNVLDKLLLKLQEKKLLTDEDICEVYTMFKT